MKIDKILIEEGFPISVLERILASMKKGVLLYENRVPVRDEVIGACELLGLEPLYIANEGKLIAIVGSEHLEQILQIMKKNKYGKEAKIIDEMTDDHLGKVLLKTTIGGTQIVDMLTREQLPRIC